jgi:hypothetical protein
MLREGRKKCKYMLALPHHEIGHVTVTIEMAVEVDAGE